MKSFITNISLFAVSNAFKVYSKVVEKVKHHQVYSGYYFSDPSTKKAIDNRCGFCGYPDAYRTELNILNYHGVTKYGYSYSCQSCNGIAVERTLKS